MVKWVSAFLFLVLLCGCSGFTTAELPNSDLVQVVFESEPLPPFFSGQRELRLVATSASDAIAELSCSDLNGVLPVTEPAVDRVRFKIKSLSQTEGQ